MKTSIVAMSLALGGCSLLGPPLPPATPRTDVAAHQAQPAIAREAYIACVRNYAQKNARAEGVPIDTLIDAAFRACTAERDAYEQLAAREARASARVLGLIDRSGARTKQALEQATSEARAVAIDAAIEARARP